MRSPANNPFEPGSDRIPRIWAGRQPQLADWRDRLRPRRVSGLYERGRTLLGEPGIGKSVLVQRIASDAARAGDWTTGQLRLPRDVDPLPVLAEGILQLADHAGLSTARERRTQQLVDRARAVTAGPVGVELGPADRRSPYATVRDLLVEVGRAAAEDGDRVVVVHLDEVQNVGDVGQLSQLLVALGDALAYEVRRELPGGTTDVVLPLTVYLTGLPEFADQASSREGATFARRFKTEVLDPISDDDLEAGLQPFVREGWEVLGQNGPASITMTPEAVDRIVALCHGDPFLFQLAGQHAWDAGTDPSIDEDDVVEGWSRARREARQHVERQLARLPAREREMLDAMASLAPEERSLTRIAQVMGLAGASQAGPTAQRLDTVRGIIDRGRPYTFRLRTVEAYLTSKWP